MKRILVLLTIIISFSFWLGCEQEQQKIAPQEVIITVNAAEPVGLIVEDGQDKVNRGMEVSNPEGQLSALSFICTKTNKAFIKIFSGLSVSDVTRLWSDLIWLENNTKIRDVHLFINSPGGDAFSGLALADQIERAREKGFKIIAYASGIIASAAVPVFAVCDVRLAAPGTIFMVHEAAIWKWPGRETASMIRSQNDLMHLLRERYIKKLVNNSNLSKLEWEELENKTTWFSADKALDWGLVDNIE